jgi:hypothetical protein
MSDNKYVGIGYNVIYAIVALMILPDCGRNNELSGWLKFTSSQSELVYSVQYPADWSFTENRGVTNFIPPGEGNPGYISIVTFDPVATPPLGVYLTYDTIRVVQKDGDNIYIRKRDPAAITERYFATITAGNYVAEFRLVADRKYDDIFDHMLISFTYE